MRSVHISWQIAGICIGIIGGVGASLAVQNSSFVLIIVGSLLVTAALLFKKLLLIPLAVLGGLVFGVFLGCQQLNKLAGYNKFYDQVVIVSGTVSEDVSKTANHELRLKIKDVSINGNSQTGEVWISARHDNPIKRSDFVVVEGKLSKGFGNFAGSMYQAKVIKVQGSSGDLALKLRDWFAEHIKSHLPEPEVSLSLGFLLGQQSALPPDLDEKLKALGLTHIVVASGYNLTILVIFARKTFQKISKWLATFFAGLMIVGFALITGFSPSMTRATLVTGLCLAAWYYGRSVHPLVLLPLIAAITLVIKPAFLWGDIGWYLSFASFAGVIILAPLINKYFWGNKEPGAVREIAITTLSAQIITLPITIFAFEQFSPLALFANLLVLPLIPVVMLLTFLTGVSAAIVPTVSDLFAQPTYWLLKYITTAVNWLAEFDFAKIDVTSHVFYLFFGYAVIFIAIIFLYKKTKFNFYNHNIIEQFSTDEIKRY